MEKRNQIDGRKFIVFALCETAIIAIGHGVIIMFPQTSPYLWYGIGVASLMAAWVVWNWPFAWVQRIKFDFQGLRNISIGWVVAVGLAIFIIYKPTISWIQKQRKAMHAHNESLRTKPVCGSTCKNFDWIVETCKREAVKVGGLTGLRASSHTGKATRHFRGCLIDKGMGWERCKKGEPRCMRLRSIGMRFGNKGLPSFIE